MNPEHWSLGADGFVVEDEEPEREEPLDDLPPPKRKPRKKKPCVPSQSSP